MGLGNAGEQVRRCGGLVDKVGMVLQAVRLFSVRCSPKLPDRTRRNHGRQGRARPTLFGSRCAAGCLRLPSDALHGRRSARPTIQGEVAGAGEEHASSPAVSSGTCPGSCPTARPCGWLSARCRSWSVPAPILRAWRSRRRCRQTAVWRGRRCSRWRVDGATRRPLSRGPRPPGARRLPCPSGCAARRCSSPRRHARFRRTGARRP